MAGYKKNGTDLDALLEPWQSGDGNAAATGYKINEADLNTKYAPASVGAAYTGGTGYYQNNADVGPRFAAKGSRQSALPIDGNSYTRARGRGTATLTFTMNANGTYAVTNDLGTVLDSGTWVPSGDAPSQYNCQFIGNGFVSGPDVDGGSDSFSNGAPSSSSLATTRDFSASASATVTSANASNSGTLTIKLFKGATLRSTTTISLDCTAAG